MTDEEMIDAVKQVDGLGSMTINQRLFASGLMDEFDGLRKEDKEKQEEFWICFRLTNLLLTK